MLCCHIVSHQGNLTKVELKLEAALSVKELRLHDQLKDYLQPEHHCFKDLVLLNESDSVEPNDTISFLLKTTIDAATWRQSRLHNAAT